MIDEKVQDDDHGPIYEQGRVLSARMDLHRGGDGEGLKLHDGSYLTLPKAISGKSSITDRFLEKLIGPDRMIKRQKAGLEKGVEALYDFRDHLVELTENYATDLENDRTQLTILRGNTHEMEQEASFLRGYETALSSGDGEQFLAQNRGHVLDFSSKIDGMGLQQIKSYRLRLEGQLKKQFALISVENIRVLGLEDTLKQAKGDIAVLDQVLDHTHEMQVNLAELVYQN